MYIIRSRNDEAFYGLGCLLAEKYEDCLSPLEKAVRNRSNLDYSTTLMEAYKELSEGIGFAASRHHQGQSRKSTANDGTCHALC